MKTLTKLYFVLYFCILGTGFCHIRAMEQEQASSELFQLLLQDNTPKENGHSYITEQIQLLLSLGANPCSRINQQLAEEIISKANQQQAKWLGAYCLPIILEQDFEQNMTILDWFFLE